ncbi:MAG: DUF6438 domain-containing protein [Methylovulum sp.]|nr:DUF6438 domain-containing protein [Methylovulum sp.]
MTIPSEDNRIGRNQAIAVLAKHSWYREFGKVVSALLILSFLASNKIYADEKPVISYADANGSLYLGVWKIKIDIFKNGNVHYFGEGSAVYLQGDHYGHISQAKVKKLIRLFVKARFFNLQDEPSWRIPLKLPQIMWDFPAAPTITFNYQGHEKTVINRNNVIYELESNLFRTVNLKQWVCFPPSVSERMSGNCNMWYRDRS